MDKKYTFIEFMVKPSLMIEYIQMHDIKTQQAIFYNYLDHMLSLCGDENKTISEIFQTTKKLKKLLLIVFIINDYYTPLFTDLMNYHPEFIKYYLDQAQQQTHLNQVYYRLLQSAIVLHHFQQFILHKDLQEDKMNQLLNISQLEKYLPTATETGMALLNVQLIIELRMIQEQYNIEHLFILHDSIQSDTKYAPYSPDKIEDYREIIASLKDELSPVTDSEDARIEPMREEVEYEINNSYFNSEILNGIIGPRMVSIYLQNGISTNNRDLIINLQKMIAMKNQDIDKIIYLYLNNQTTLSQLEQFIKAIDISKLYDISIINILGQLIFLKGEQNKQINSLNPIIDQQAFWKDIKKCLILLISKFNKQINDTIKGVQELLESINKNQITYPYKIDQYSVNVQLTLSLIFSNMILLHYSNDKSTQVEFKSYVDCLILLFERLQQEQQLEILTQYIDNCLSKQILEVIQCIMIKSLPDLGPTEFTIYYSMIAYLNTEAVPIELKWPNDLKIQIIVLCFKREKQLMIQTYDQIDLIDQLQYRYSKIYKKQSLFYHKLKDYSKSLRYIIKFFQAYLYTPNFETQSYLKETLILLCLHANFKQLNANVHVLITSQFVSVTIENSIFEGLEMNQDLAQFFFDGRMIEKICALNQGNSELMRLMIQRIQDQDSHINKSTQLLMQIQEKYLNLYLSYLNEQLLK